MYATRHGILAAAITCALTFSTQSHALDFLRTGAHVFNYNYAELKYVDVDDADGLALVGSADFRPNLALRVEYTALSAGSFDLDVLRLGATNYIGSTTYKQADWVFQAGLDIAGGDGDDDTGIYLSGGTRYAVSDALEVNGTLEVSTLFDTDLTAQIAALYEISTGFAALAELEFGDDTALSLGIRFYWR